MTVSNVTDDAICELSKFDILATSHLEDNQSVAPSERGWRKATGSALIAPLPSRALRSATNFLGTVGKGANITRGCPCPPAVTVPFAALFLH